MTRHAWIWWVLGLALILRVVGLNWGLPQLYHQDEPIIVNHALAIGVGGLNPHFFALPPFAIYFLFSLYALFFILGKLVGIFPDAAAFGSAFLKDPSAFYMIGRVALGALPGTATVYVLYRFGQRFFSEWIGLAAALLLAIVPIHVQHSHYIYTDALLTFALTVLLYQLCALREDGSYRKFAFAGALLGWAVSIKYTAVLIVPSVLLAGFFVFKDNFFKAESFKKLFWGTAWSLAVFALAAPYTFLDWPEFIRQITVQAGAESHLGWMHHLSYSITHGSSHALVALALLGLIFWGMIRKEPGLVLISFVAVYYAVNAVFSQPFSRYMLPLIPVLCLAAATGWNWIDQKIGHRGFRIALMIGVLIGPLFPSLQSDLLFLSRDTRSECAAWIESHAAADSTIVLDDQAMGPRLQQNAQQIREKFSLLGESGNDLPRRKRLELLLRAAKGKRAYQVYYLREKDAPDGSQFLFQQPRVRAEWNELKKISAQYLVINYTQSSPEKRAFKDSAMPHLDLVASFSPFKSASQRETLDPYASTAAPHTCSDLFSRKRLGPYLEVYRINS